MGRVCGRFIAPFVLCITVSALAGMPAVGALVPDAHSPSFFGRYSVEVKVTGSSQYQPSHFRLLANGTAPAPGGVATWSNKGKNLTIVFAPEDEVLTAVQNSVGLSSKQHPGTITLGGSPIAVWYAVKTS
jgi:hypothetical protein